jgi:intracellular multiplication protein IcmV
MSSFKIIKKTVTAGWNVSAWVGLKQIKENCLMIKDLAKGAFSTGKEPVEIAKGESFAGAMQRLGLTEADLQDRIKKCSQIIFFCGLLSIPMLAYTIYIFCSHFYLSGLVCLMLTFVLWAYAFREHFSRFQLQQRRLGCSLQEWFAHTCRINAVRKK